MRVYIGFDPREAAAFAVARSSIRQWNKHILVHGLVLDDLRKQGLYTRPTEVRLGKTWDVISGAYQSTEFANSRFLVPHLAREGWAAFMDCDMLVRTNIARVFDKLDHNKAVYCVKHDHMPNNDTKMDGQAQTAYPRKNWSSFMLFNCSHPANAGLTLDLINSAPGRELHRFCWLEDHHIGELGPEWNYLVGHTETNVEPKVVHFTDGGPWFHGFENVPYADEWRAEMTRWAL